MGLDARGTQDEDVEIVLGPGFQGCWVPGFRVLGFGFEVLGLPWTLQPARGE